MKYFTNITNLEQAQKQYRILAKKYHPDMGGTDTDFQDMNFEYKKLLIQLHQKNKSNNKKKGLLLEKSELMKELGKIAKVLVEKQVPQAYLKQKINATESKLQKDILEGIVSFLNTL